MLNDGYHQRIGAALSGVPSRQAVHLVFERPLMRDRKAVEYSGCPLHWRAGLDNSRLRSARGSWSHQLGCAVHRETASGVALEAICSRRSNSRCKLVMAFSQTVANL